MLQRSVVGEDQEPLAVEVETARRVKTWTIHVVCEGRSALGIGEAGQHPIGFVEEKDSHLRALAHGGEGRDRDSIAEMP